jgi:hypothetical protein
MKTMLWVLVASLGGLSAFADDILLTNGKKIVGMHRKDPKQPDKVIVDVPVGTIVLEAKAVSSINPGRTLLHEYHDKYAAIKDSKNAADFWTLAAWARENRLTRYVTELAARTVALEPDHARARAELRHEKQADGKWLTFDEAQEKRGFRSVDGAWLTQAEIELREMRRMELAERARKIREDRETAKKEQREARERAVADYNHMMAAQLSRLDGYFYSPSFAFTTPYFRPYWWAPYVRSRSYYQDGWKYGGGGGYGTFDLFRFIPDPFLKK